MQHLGDWSRLREANRIAREQRTEERDQIAARRRVNATPETLRKLERPVIHRLLERGQIGEEQHAAGEEINRVFLAITGALFPRVSDPFRQWTRGSTAEWPAHLKTAYFDRYCPWRDEAGAVIIRHRQTLAGLVIAMAVDNYGPQQLALMWGMDRRRVLDLVRNSLWRYAELAGWTPRALRASVVLSLATTDPP